MNEGVKKKVLLIEDDPGIARMIGTIFNIGKVDFIHADTGRKGLDLIARDDIGLVICDIMLPDIIGYDILKQLRLAEANEQIANRLYFIFLTAFADPADVQRGLDAGADKYITKPFAAADLLNAVRDFMYRAA